VRNATVYNIKARKWYANDTVRSDNSTVALQKKLKKGKVVYLILITTIIISATFSIVAKKLAIANAGFNTKVL